MKIVSPFYFKRKKTKTGWSTSTSLAKKQSFQRKKSHQIFEKKQITLGNLKKLNYTSLTIIMLHIYLTLYSQMLTDIK